MITLNNVSLTVSMTIFRVRFKISIRSGRINMAASHVSASPKFSVPSADWTTLLDFTPAKSI